MVNKGAPELSLTELPQVFLFMLDHCDAGAYESGLAAKEPMLGLARTTNGCVNLNKLTTKFGNIFMANHKSAKKRARQTVKRNETNRSRRSAIHTLTKEAEVAAASGDVKTAKAALHRAESALAKGAARGTLHWRTAARKASRLAKRAKAAKKA